MAHRSPARSWSIQARIVDGAGIPGNPEVQVNALTGGHQTAPSVAAIVNNRFVVAFESEAAAKRIRAQGIEDSPLLSDGFESGDTSAWAP